MILKVIKVGTSLAVVIPKTMAQEENLNAGTHMTLEKRDGGFFYKKESTEKMPRKGDEAAVWADRFIDKYKNALDALSEK